MMLLWVVDLADSLNMSLQLRNSTGLNTGFAFKPSLPGD